MITYGDRDLGEELNKRGLGYILCDPEENVLGRIHKIK
jgi:hypothetical protein